MSFNSQAFPLTPSPAYSKRTETALIGLVCALFWLYLAADLATRSMGLDGVIYATIAKLAAAGEGSFWFPPYFDLDVEWFRDHPPLGLWIQSQWFTLFGNAFWVEKTFCMLMIAIIAALMVTVCRTIDADRPAWWSLAIFFTMPVASHALKNNFLESMVAVTALFAVWAAWYGRKTLWMNVLVAAGCLAGLLIKGPVGLFPLVAPALFALIIDGSPRQAIVATAVSVGCLLLAMLAIFYIETAQVSIAFYLKSQLLESLAGERHIDHGRVYQLGQLVINAGVAAFFIFVAWLSSRNIRFSRTSWAFLGLGLAASLPLLISPRQYRHYLLPCLPFFAIWANLIVSPLLARWSSKYIWVATALVFLFATTRAYWYFDATGKDADQLRDVAAIAQAMASSEISIDHVEFCGAHYPLRAYLARHHGLRTSSTGKSKGLYYVVCGTSQPDERLERVLNLSDDLALWFRPPAKQ
ncbi:MAG: glycosyltransferase family 39 protein [Gammaproteobacteria bacterium]|nr:glycosyltransferase family 39 protein [Gammaproteobacteria bacterium]